MSYRTSPDKETIINIRISTIITIVLIILAVICAALGFSNAGDSRVAPAIVSIYLFASAALFAAQFGYGIRRKERWQRVAAAFSIFATVFTTAMAVAFYQVLSQVQMPF